MTDTNGIEQGLEVVAAHPEKADFLGGRDEALIADAERELGVQFPPSYRRFLAELGAGDFEGREFYGVIDRERMQLNGPPNAIGSTLARRHRDPHWPPELIVVSDTGFGPDYVLDLSRRDENGESPVLVWSEGQTREAGAERDADSFGEHFTRRVTKAAAEED